MGCGSLPGGKAMLRVNLMIGDRELSAADGRTFQRIDPLTGEVASEAAAATIPDAIAAAEAAARAFPRGLLWGRANAGQSFWLPPTSLPRAPRISPRR